MAAEPPESGTTYRLATLVPAVVWLSVLQATLAAFVIGAGGEVAKILVSIFGGHQAEVRALLVGGYLLVGLWIFYRQVELERHEAPDAADVGSRLTSFFALFLSTADLLKAAADAQRYEWMLYAAHPLVLLIAAPLFSIKLVPLAVPATARPERVRHEALLALLRLVGRGAGYGAAVAGFTALFCSIYFALLNDGIGEPSDRLLPSLLQDVWGLPDRTGFWIVNPAILTLGALQLSVFHYNEVAGGTHRRADRERPIRFRYWRSRLALIVIVAAALFLNMLTGLVLISDDTIHYDASYTPQLWPKMLATLSYTACFFGAFYAARLVNMQRTIADRPPHLSLSPFVALLIFALFGAIAGALLLVIRESVVDAPPVHLHLIWMHAAGFALAGLGLLVGGRIATAFDPTLVRLL